MVQYRILLPEALYCARVFAQRQKSELIVDLTDIAMLLIQENLVVIHEIMHLYYRKPGPIVGEFTKIIDEGLSFLKGKYRITAKQLQREGKLNRQQYEAFVLSMERIVNSEDTREESFCDLLSLRQLIGISENADSRDSPLGLITAVMQSGVKEIIEAAYIGYSHMVFINYLQDAVQSYSKGIITGEWDDSIRQRKRHNSDVRLEMMGIACDTYTNKYHFEPTWQTIRRRHQHKIMNPFLKFAQGALYGGDLRRFLADMAGSQQKLEDDRQRLTEELNERSAAISEIESCVAGR